MSDMRDFGDKVYAEGASAIRRPRRRRDLDGDGAMRTYNATVENSKTGFGYWMQVTAADADDALEKAEDLLNDDNEYIRDVELAHPEDLL